MRTAKRALVFDDDVAITGILTYILEEDGWEVISVTNSNNVVQEVVDTKPTLIIMDNNIPDYGGIASTRKLKQQPELKNIPVVYCTANNDIEVLAEKAGADGYLPKPFTLGNLETIISTLLPELT